jgi:hypothetical protein
MITSTELPPNSYGYWTGSPTWGMDNSRLIERILKLTKGKDAGWFYQFSTQELKKYLNRLKGTKNEY